MTKGELRFYLREVHPYWSTPRISEEKISELEREKLIERSMDPVSVIRLTKEGAKEKDAGRHRNTNSTLNLARTQAGRRQKARRTKQRPTRAAY
jgi:hypothetical protein